jgi:signal transduction histidine kinase/ActR/RegA family two-component response regulator
MPQHLMTTLQNGVVALRGSAIEWANPAFWGLVLGSEEPLPRDRDLLKWVAPSEQAALRRYLENTSSPSSTFQLQLLSSQNITHPVEFHFSHPDSQNQKRRVGMLREFHGPLQDSEESRHRAAHSLRLRSLGEVAAGVAHDFNNTLTTILGRLTMAKQKLYNQEPIHNDLAVMEAAAQSARDLVMRVRDFSRPASLKKTQETINLGLLLEESLLFTQTQVPATVSVEKDLHPVPLIRGNRSELLEVFVNLLNNALDAVHTEGVIRLSCFKEGESVVILIQDDGVGMAPQTQERLFEPFFSTRAEQGSGLGLSVSHWILRRHDARISVESEEGRGTQFRLVFPLEAGDIKPKTLKAAPLSIVVVDDDSNVAEVIKDLLEDDHHSVSVVTELDKMQHFKCETPPDLVITDLDLAGTSGWDLARSVRYLYPETVIGLITGWPLNASEEELRIRGIDFALNKPFTSHALNKVLERLTQEVERPA